MPEVQNVLQGLLSLQGARIIRARPEENADRRIGAIQLAEGRRIETLRRRGKLIIAELDDCSSLTFHLGMTGRLTLGAEAGSRHRRALVETSRGRLEYHDPRRFGRISRQAPGQTDPLLGKMGPEVADAEADSVAEKLRRRRTPIKAALLDQRIVAGIGNIYADEALWTTSIHPATPACDLTLPQVRRLLDAAAEIMAAAVVRGGSSIRDYRKADGRQGNMQQQLKAYGRSGLPCMRCGETLRNVRIAGRSSSHCPTCQKEPS